MCSHAWACTNVGTDICSQVLAGSTWKCRGLCLIANTRVTVGVCRYLTEGMCDGETCRRYTRGREAWGRGIHDGDFWEGWGREPRSYEGGMWERIWELLRATSNKYLHGGWGMWGMGRRGAQGVCGEKVCVGGEGVWGGEAVYGGRCVWGRRCLWGEKVCVGEKVWGEGWREVWEGSCGGAEGFREKVGGSVSACVVLCFPGCVLYTWACLSSDYLILVERNSQLNCQGSWWERLGGRASIKESFNSLWTSSEPGSPSLLALNLHASSSTSTTKLSSV